MDCDNEEVQATKNLKRKSDNLEEQYVSELQELYQKYKNDNEELHILCDECLLDFLEDKGFHKIVKQYREIKEKNMFWYA